MDEEQSKITPQFLAQVDRSDDHSLRKGMEEQRLGGKDDQFIFTHVEFDKSVDYPHGGIQQAIDYEDLIEIRRTTWIRSRDFMGFPGGAVVKNLPANAGDTGSSPGLGRSHMPRSN